MKIKNMPEYAWRCKYIVFRTVDNECWFFGAYDEISKALCAMQECSGSICETEEVQHDTV